LSTCFIYTIFLKFFLDVIHCGQPICTYTHTYREREREGEGWQAIAILRRSREIIKTYADLIRRTIIPAFPQINVLCAYTHTHTYARARVHAYASMKMVFAFATMCDNV